MPSKKNEPHFDCKLPDNSLFWNNPDRLQLESNKVTMNKKKICVFTGGRAEYGLLRPLLDEIRNDQELELQLLVTGMHLSTEFGLTYSLIEEDGYAIDEKVEMILSSDTPAAVCKSMGLGLIGFGDALNRLKPDFLVLLGDRFETLAGAISALVCRVPIAHIQGGELTFGATDDAMRHSITKMSMLHFTYTETYRRRVIQLGEHPERVFNVGGLNTEVISRMKLLSRKELEHKIGFKLGNRNALVTFHPVTLENNTAEVQFQALLNVLQDNFELNLIFTKTNADAEGRIINSLIDVFVQRNQGRSIAFTSMGQLLYLSAMRQVDVVLGNSSSGIIETPSFKLPTVNIGDREKGRIRAANIVDCDPNEKQIALALKRALAPTFSASLKDMVNPYHRKYTARNIKNVIKQFDTTNRLKKVFFDQ